MSTEKDGVGGVRYNELFRHRQMMEVESALSDFSTCDRTGRRNAVPDIKGESEAVCSSEFPKNVSQMDLQTSEAVRSAMPYTPQGNESGSVTTQAGEAPS